MNIFTQSAFYIQKGIAMCNSFKNKVLQFWKAFEEEESIIRQMIDNNIEGKTLTSFTKSILKIAFNEVQFQIGLNLENKYELTLTPQGDRIKLIEYYYWSRFMPQSIAENWDIHASMPALKNTQYKVEMFNIVLDDNDLTLYPQTDHIHSKIELQVYCPKLENKTDSQRYAVFFTLLDQHISELYSIEHINNIQFINTKLATKGINIKELKQYIDSEINLNGWINSSNPLDAYIGYRVEQSTASDWILREDIYTGYSSCTAPISAYHFKDDTFFRKHQQNGIIFGFLFFDNLDTPEDHLVPFRGVIEDQITEKTLGLGISNCIGGATGFHFSYIDLVIYDYEAFIKVAKDIFETYNFEQAGFSYFWSGSEPIILSRIEQ